MQIRIHKLQGAGNDFVGFSAISNPELLQIDKPSLVKALCDRRRGIGADGAICLHQPQNGSHDFEMIYYNADGSRGEMCGNGARCAVRFASLQGVIGEQTVFNTDAGEYRGALIGDEIEISFPPVNATPRKLEIDLDGKRIDGDFITVGVPHYVVWSESHNDLNIQSLGSALRYHPEFEKGTNVNFAEERDGILYVRTYERGVEEETLACGTGAVATALSKAYREGLQGAQSQRLIPTGNEPLGVAFVAERSRVTEIRLTGPAKLVFSTIVTWDQQRNELLPASD